MGGYRPELDVNAADDDEPYTVGTRRRYLILCCNAKCNTKSFPVGEMSSLLSLSFEALIECSRWCSSHFSSSQGATTVLQLSFASCCVSNDRSIHRRDDVNADKTNLSGEKSASESSFLNGVNFVFRKAS